MKRERASLREWPAKPAIDNAYLQLRAILNGTNRQKPEALAPRRQDAELVDGRSHPEGREGS
jgi:hypothetical protein